MRRALIAALFAAALFSHHDVASAQTAPEYVYCVSSTSTTCNTASNPGNGTQGDAAWLAFGKLNLDIAALQPPTPQYSLIYANNNSYGGVLPGSNGIWCPQWTSLSAPPTLVTCPGSSSTSFSAVTSGTNNSAVMVVNSGASISPINSGVVNANEINGVAAGTFATQNYATPPAIGGSTPAAGAFTTLSASSTVSGTGFSSYLASPPAIGGTTPGAGAFSSVTDTGITGSTQCLHASSAGLISGTGSDCGSGGSGAFNSLTSGTNTTAAMLVGAGASLGYSSSGTISASNVGGMTAPSTSGTLGYLGLPLTGGAAKTGNYTAALGDVGTRTLFSLTSAATYTIPANSSVSFPVSTMVLTVQNSCASTASLTITQTTDTFYFIPSAGTGSRTLAPCGWATITEEALTVKDIGGQNLTKLIKATAPMWADVSAERLS